MRSQHASSRSARSWGRGSLIRRGLRAGLVLLVFALAGVAASRVLPESFRSTAVVLVTPTGLPDSSPGSTLPRTESAISLETEAEMVLSADVVRAAAAAAGDHRNLVAVRADVLVEVPDNTTVLRITAERPQPEQARRLAQAFADSYLSNRRAEAQTVRQADLDGLDQEISALTSELAKVSRRLPDASPPDQAYAQARQRMLIDQLGAARNSRDRLAATHVGGGSVLSAAARPGRPSLSPHQLAGPAALALGLIAAVAVGSRKRRRDGLVRGAEEVEQLTGTALIGFPGRTPSAVSSVQIDLLRQDVERVLPEPGGVVLVIGTGPAGAELLTALAAAIAANGRRVTLVGADFADPSVAEALGVPAGRPGLAEAVLQGAPLLDDFPLPGVRFVSPGSAGGTGPRLLPSSAMATTIRELRGTAGIVLLQIPLAEAPLVARLCDAAVFFVEVGAVRRDDLLSVSRQLRAGGTVMAGAVCLDPSRRRVPVGARA